MNENQANRDKIRKKFEDAQARIMEIAKNVALCSEDDYTKIPEYQAALTFFQDFSHKEGVDYSAVVDYASKLNVRLETTDKMLDEKADSIIKYLSGGSALITLAAILSIKTDSPKAILVGLVALCCLIPSLVCAVISIYYAIKVRIPQPNASPPPITDAVTIAETYKKKEDIELNLWLILNPICEVAYIRNKNKASFVKMAHRFYLGSVACLLVPLVGAGVCLNYFRGLP